MRQNLEMTLKADNALEVVANLKKYRDLKAYVVTCDKVRVWFNDSRITAKKVIKLIQAAQGKPDGRRKPANVSHIKNAA